MSTKADRVLADLADQSEGAIRQLAHLRSTLRTAAETPRVSRSLPTAAPGRALAVCLAGALFLAFL